MKFIRAKRVSNCYIPNSKFVSSTNPGFSGGSNRNMLPGTYIPGIMYQYMIPGTYIPGTYRVRNYVPDTYNIGLHPKTKKKATPSTRTGSGTHAQRDTHKQHAYFSRKHHLAGRGDAGQDAAAAKALLGHYHANVTGSDYRQGRHRLGAQGGLYGAYFRLSQ